MENPVRPKELLAQESLQGAQTFEYPEVEYPEGYAGQQAQAAVIANPNLNFDEAYKQARNNGTILDDAIDMMYALKERGVLESALTEQQLAEMEPKKQLEYIRGKLDQVGVQYISDRDEVTVQSLSNEYWHLPRTSHEEIINQAGGLGVFADARMSREAHRQQRFQQEVLDPLLDQWSYESNSTSNIIRKPKEKRETNARMPAVDPMTARIMAARGIDHTAGVANVDEDKLAKRRAIATHILEGIQHELTPVLNVLSKNVAAYVIANAAGADISNFWLGSGSRDFVKYWRGLSVEEKTARLPAIEKALRNMYRDSGYFYTFGRYNINEQLFFMLEKSVEGEQGTGWTALRNLETLLETTVVAGYLWKFGKGVAKGGAIQRAAHAAEENAVTRAAGENGNFAAQAESIQQQLDGGARLTGGDPLAVAGSTMPKAEIVEDTLRPQANVGADVLETTARVDAELGKGRTVSVADTMSPEAKAKAQARYKQEGLPKPETDSRVWVANSVVKELEDGSGMYVAGMLGKTGNKAFHSLSELSRDWVYLNPVGEATNMRIVRQNRQGNLREIKATHEDIKKARTVEEVMRTHMTDAALTKHFREAKLDDLDYGILREEYHRRGLTDPALLRRPQQQMFIRYDDARPYHPMDNLALRADTFRNSWLPDWLHVPSTRFGSNIVNHFWESMAKARRTERLFMHNQFKPYWKLNTKDKRTVDRMLQLEESWAGKNGLKPSMEKFAAEMEVGPKAYQGWLAVREGFDTMQAQLNVRRFQELSAAGHKTIRSTSGGPMYHGKPVDRGNITGGTFFDPVAEKGTRLSRKKVDELYAKGGRVIVADEPIEANGKFYSRILVDNENYKLGRLSPNPVEYYPGWAFRFNDHPYYLMKITPNAIVDGKATGQAISSPLKTAANKLDGERYLERNFTWGTVKLDDGTTKNAYIGKSGKNYYEIQTMADMSSMDRVLAQRQVFSKQRLLYGDRTREGLHDLSGQPSPLMDLNRSLEQGTALFSKQMNMEDILRSYKTAFIEEFKDLPELAGAKARLKPSRQLLDDLKDGAKNASGPDRVRYDNAIKMAKYLRSLDNLDDGLTLSMREMLLRAANWAGRAMRGKNSAKIGSLEKWAQSADPLQAMRSSAFFAFIVARPARMVVLQAMQPLMLAFKDPIYVLSTKGLIDSIAVRWGVNKIAGAGGKAIPDMPKLAAMMGMEPKAMRRYLQEIERAGYLDMIDAQAVQDGTMRMVAGKLRKDTPLDNALTVSRKLGTTIFRTLKQGFDMGESMNKIGTLNIAMRETLRKKGYKSVLELSEPEWRQLFYDAENLSLAMNPTNKAFYQTGALSLPFQFMSFSHKASLLALGQNPALKGNRNVVKFWIGMGTLYGADSIGMKDFVRETLRSAELELPEPAVELIAGGGVETFFNHMVQVVNEETKPMDWGPMKPTVFDYGHFTSMMYDNWVRNPFLGSLGASGSIVSDTWNAAKFFGQVMVHGDSLTVQERLAIASKQSFQEILPQMSNITRAHMAAHYQRLFFDSGEHFELEQTWLNLLASGIFGLKTDEEIMIHKANSDARDNNAIVQDLTRNIHRFGMKMAMHLRDGELTWDDMMQVAVMMAEMAAAAPEGRSVEVLDAAMTGFFDENDPSKTIVNILAERAMTNQLTKEQVLDQITAMKSLSPRDLAALNYILDVMMDQNIASDKQLLEDYNKFNTGRQ